MTTTEQLIQIPVRLDFDTHASVYSKAMSHLDNAATKELDRVDFDHRLRELVRIRASQLNGCAYCIDMHTKDARALGESEQRIYALSAWREAPFFTARERAALAFTEAVTRIADGGVPDDVYEATRKHFSDEEIVNLTMAIATINVWNRLAITFRSDVGSYQPAAHAVAS